MSLSNWEDERMCCPSNRPKWYEDVPISPDLRSTAPKRSTLCWGLKGERGSALESGVSSGWGEGGRNSEGRREGGREVGREGIEGTVREGGRE